MKKLCYYGILERYAADNLNIFSEKYDVHCILDTVPKQEHLELLSRKITVEIYDKKNFINRLKVLKRIKQVNKKVDGFIIHYLSSYIMFIVNFFTSKKNIYFSYGSDIHIKGIKSIFLKKTLKKINYIFCNTESDKKLFIEKYDVIENKICKQLWCPIDNNIFNKKDKNSLKKKWNIDKQYVIFLPRCNTPFYNNLTYIQALKNLDSEIKNNLKILLINWGNNNYIHEIEKLAKKIDIDLTIFNYLTSEEISEIYCISDMTVNIPENDNLGGSNIESILCGTPVLLNDEIDTYKELYINNKYCLYVSPKDDADIIQKTTTLIKNREIFIDDQYQTFLRNYVDINQIKKIILEKTEKVIK
jgi:glycosyltransferase involved in cell wall biosynthesis